jgi:hypothetical protein
MFRDEQEKATAILCALYDLPANNTYIVEEICSINASLHLNKDASFAEAFKYGPLKNGARTAIAVSCQILSQITGINIITYYAATTYGNEIGMSLFISRVVTACNGTQYFIASMFSPYLIKHINRRPLLLFASAGLATSMVVLAIMNRIGGKGPGIVAAGFLFVFNTFLGIAWAQLSWIIPAEIVSLSTRAPVDAL